MEIEIHLIIYDFKPRLSKILFVIKYVLSITFHYRRGMNKHECDLRM